MFNWKEKNIINYFNKITKKLKIIHKKCKKF